MFAYQSHRHLLSLLPINRYCIDSRIIKYIMTAVIESQSAITSGMLVTCLFILNNLDQSNGIQNINPIDGKHYRPILRFAREGFYNFIGSNGEDEQSFNINLKSGVSIYCYELLYYIDLL